jgi:MtN3 and saliva related transmembrane protein
MHNYAELTGYIAAVLTTFSFVPQVMRVWRTRSVADISLGMYSMYTFGIAIWLIYGVLIMSWPVILSNLVTLIFAGCVLAMKIRFGQ